MFIPFYGSIILHCVYRLHFIHYSSAGGPLSCCQLLALVNDTTMNEWANICLSLPLSILWGIYPWVKLLDHAVILFNTVRNHQTSPHQLHSFTFSSAIHEGSNFSISSTKFVISSFCFYNSHPKACKVGISLWFWFAYPRWLMMLSMF